MFRGRTVQRQARNLHVEPLEGRALLSAVGGSGPTQGEVVTAIYEHELHRVPTTRELRHGVTMLRAGVPAIREAAHLLTSPAYRATHRTHVAFVDALYRDVLGSDVDPAGQQFWVTALRHQHVSRFMVARAFLSSPNSYLNAPQAGYITNVSATNGWASGVVGSTTAFVAGVFNRGTPPTTITINVTAGGNYVLNQSNSSFIGNNSGRTWSGFTLTILPSSTAGASFVSSSDVSGHFPTVNRSASALNFSGGTVTSGTNVIVNGFQPYTRFSTTQGGTIVIQETPVNA